MILIDFGDAMIETKQVSPGTRPDNTYHFGLWPGSLEEGVDAARLMLAGECKPE